MKGTGATGTPAVTQQNMLQARQSLWLSRTFHGVLEASRIPPRISGSISPFISEPAAVTIDNLLTECKARTSCSRILCPFFIVMSLLVPANCLIEFPLVFSNLTE